MTDWYTIHRQLEHLQAKSNPNLNPNPSTKWEWLVNQDQSSSCSNMGHFNLLKYFDIAENGRWRRYWQPSRPPTDKLEEN
ncbi:Splicing factor 3B subunit 5 [Cricetulus griseus]|uniref:Splicing factor 3B subunit 5 n=1 Tax=Cricetulus griseus TaxID=10029 RepID=G3H7G8_CRIGR|nr:Splicing factor 3B subunit 5 [Cricetulus griseus]ERE83338.1 splicing factor 3B subunit 5-like protein [Cricetulus griseus]